MSIETAEIIPADVSAKMDAAMAGIGSTKHGEDVDAALDAAVDNVPERFRENAGLGKKPEKKEQPKAAEPEQSEDAPAGDEAEAEAEAEKATKSEPETSYALEKALAALRYDEVPSETIDALMQNQKGREQLLAWGSKAAARQADVSRKIKDQAEELKRAPATNAETTATTGESATPTPNADFTSSLEAFKEYGEEFQKGQGSLARAIHSESVKAARDSVLNEIQPAVKVLLETRSVLEELVTEMLDREFGERFPDLVEDKASEDAKAAFKRMWGNGEAYKDAAPTILGRLRAARKDAYGSVKAQMPAPRKDDSQTKANRIPAAPSRTVPTKARTIDEQVEDVIEKSMKKYAER